MMRLLPLSLGLVLTTAILANPVRADDWNRLKTSVIGAGDFNADGVPDLLVTSRCDLPPQLVWILSGSDGSVIRTVCEVKSEFGVASSLVACGDVDLDGFQDTLISIFSGSIPRFADLFRGGSHPDLGSGLVHSGRTGKLLFTIPDTLHALGAVDVDADGRPDLVVSAVAPRTRERAYSRTVRVHSGADGRLLYEIQPPLHPAAEDFGSSFANLDDMDGDGREDFLVGAMERSSPYSPGHVYCYSGRYGVLLDAVQGDVGLDGYGWSLARIDDVDGDGRSDFLAGAANRCVEVRSGRDLHLIHRIDAKYRYALCDAFASSLDAVGDIDMDCVPDWVVGANEDLVPFDVGYAWLVSGRTGRVLRELYRSDDQGVDACGAGDVDADGVPDIALALEGKFNPANRYPYDQDERAEQDHKVLVLSGRTGGTLWEVNLRALRTRAMERRAK